MAANWDTRPLRSALAAIAQDFHQRGWMPGTAGNLSARSQAAPDSFWITVSGLPKGQLDEHDFIRLGIESGKVVQRLQAQDQPSAECSIHQQIYRLYPAAGACFHVHSIDACLCTRHLEPTQTAIDLPPLELIKGLGIWQQQPQVCLPLFANHLDVPQIAAEIEQRFRRELPQIEALMIRDHGVTVWGNNLQQAYNRLEIIEFLMTYLARSA